MYIVLDKVESDLLKYLERCIAAAPLTLDTLSKIEEKLVGEFELETFESLKSGSFLRFVTKTASVKSVRASFG